MAEAHAARDITAITPEMPSSGKRNGVDSKRHGMADAATGFRGVGVYARQYVAAR